jgi:hypothetical protein
MRNNPAARKRQAIYYETWYANHKRNRAHNYQLKIAKWKQDNPEKVRASRFLQKQVALGKIKKPKTCEICWRIKKLNGHHWDYDKPEKVTWVCHSCHKRIHQNSV